MAERLRAELLSGPPLRLAVLFGSRAKGRARDDSDFDVGIIPADPALSLRDELQLAVRLSARLGAEVDVVRLDVEDAVLGAEVARDGVVLFEAAPGTFAAYRADAMSPANVALVAKKLGVLEEHLRRLRERRPADVAAFVADTLLQDAIAMSVLVAVQEATDIALHIASDEGWELAPTYREGFGVLARHGVIDEALADSLGAAAKLRNRIAHGYASMDPARLWNELPDGIATFAAFAAAISEFLQRP
jgi:uncharacterized protein YutE (UPF0331/DUF86 family)/predicted nucleotidyltransferase